MLTELLDAYVRGEGADDMQVLVMPPFPVPNKVMRLSQLGQPRGGTYWIKCWSMG